MSNWIDANPYLNYYTLPSGAKAYHTGADLNLNNPTWDADKGKPVHATGNGVVTYAQLVPTGTWGRLIVIRHTRPNGEIVHSRYGHLASMAVTEGEVVNRGDVIGTIGGTEWGMPNHLHFDISTSGILESNPTHWPGTSKTSAAANYVNPKTFLQQFVPTTPTGIDMAKYFTTPDGQPGDIVILKNNWGAGDERQQVQMMGGYTYITKNSQWERRKINANTIQLLLDTSPGDGEYYTVTAAGWLPRLMKPGDTYERKEAVQFYRKSDCAAVPGKSSNWTTLIRFDALLSTMTTPGGVTFKNVAKLSWLVNGMTEEEYWYAPGAGLVMWRNKAGMESYAVQVIPRGEQLNNVMEAGCFGP